MIEETMRQNLFVLAQAYATSRGQSLATVSKQIHGNQAFLENFLKGNISTTLRTYDVMVNRLRARWPRNLKWPKTASIPKLGKIIDKGFVDI